MVLIHRYNRRETELIFGLFVREGETHTIFIYLYRERERKETKRYSSYDRESKGIFE